MKLGVLGDERLLENDDFRVRVRGEIVADNFNCVLRNGRMCPRNRCQRVPVGDEVETFVCGIVLQADPVCNAPNSGRCEVCRSAASR